MAKAESKRRISERFVLIDSESWLILDWLLIGSGNVSLFFATLCSVGAHALYGMGVPALAGLRAFSPLQLTLWAYGVLGQGHLLPIEPSNYWAYYQGLLC